MQVLAKGNMFGNEKIPCGATRNSASSNLNERGLSKTISRNWQIPTEKFFFKEIYT
jgi:hypothetical protein